MKIKEEDKDLNYWKNNCEEDYLHTPISVLRYITKLEEAVNNGVLDDVSKQSELLKAFIDFYNYRNTGDKTIYYDEIEIFIDSL
tara:strand:- start:116 stop:367 length:252 start_codon:yes stop_codon:yes gene_type:complete